MMDLRFTLLTDGASDQVLIRHITWLLKQHVNRAIAVQPTWAELRDLPRPPKGLAEKIETAIELFPCDLLFIHRDAEKEDPRSRVREINQALNRVAVNKPPTISVVPVRMQEAWILFDEPAIRNAAGNPHGDSNLSLPKLKEIEELADPKQELNRILREACGLSGRRRRRFSEATAAHRVAELIDDFSPLRALSAFQTFESEVIRVIRESGWE
jgi:hypothetical protein